MISKVDRGGVFGDAGKMKASVIREANEFAEKQGKIAIPLSSSEKPMQVGSFATYEYQFRVVSEGDPEAKRTSLVPRANMVIEKKEDIKIDITNKSNDKVDLYTELSKLDDLKKKGIITEKEFQDLKRELLSQ